jgi:hypothetical protein
MRPNEMPLGVSWWPVQPAAFASCRTLIAIVTANSSDMTHLSDFFSRTAHPSVRTHRDSCGSLLVNGFPQNTTDHQHQRTDHPHHLA